MRIKIRGGTVTQDEKPVCHTCRYATIVRGAGLDDIIECAQLSYSSQQIRIPVTFCSKYVSREHPSLYTHQLAWVLRSDGTKTRVGFVRAGDIPSRQRLVLPDDEFLD